MMKFQTFLPSLFLALLVALPLANAQENTYSPKIALLSVDRLLSQSRAGQAFNQSLNVAIEEIKAIRQVAVDKLMADEKQLNAEQGLLSEAAFQERLRALIFRQQQIASQDEQVQRDLELRRFAFGNMVLEEVNTVVKAYGEEIGVDMVLDLSNRVVLISSEYDITDVILEKIDRRIPDLPAEHEINVSDLSLTGRKSD